MVQRLTRLPDWRERLAAALQPLLGAPFVWADNDCISGLAVTVVKALTGLDLRVDWPAYASAEEALDALRQRGFEDLPAALGSIFPQVSVLAANVGDLALLRTMGGVGYAVGMVNPSTILVPTANGLGHCGWDRVIAVYQVGSHEEATTP